MARNRSNNSIHPLESGMDALTQGLQQGLGGLIPMGGSGSPIDVSSLLGSPERRPRRSGQCRLSRRERLGQERVNFGMGPFSVSASGQNPGDLLQQARNTAIETYGYMKGIGSVCDTIKNTVKRYVDMKCSLTEYEEKKRIDLKYKAIQQVVKSEEPEGNGTDPEGEEFEEIDFIDAFDGKFERPSLTSFPSILVQIFSGLPRGYWIPMLLHLLAMFGALCFSKVRAMYLDGKRHAPNLQVIIEGGWGQGKAKFEDIFHRLFGRVIESDRGKLLEENDGTLKKTRPHRIIQTAGIGLTRAKMLDVLADNDGVHIFIFESEIKALLNSLRGTCGITTDHLRKAFENGFVYQNNKLSNSRSGNYPIFLNYTFTGTMGDTSRFIKQELEGGTLSRIAWTSIPEAGKKLENLQFDDEEVNRFRDQIDEWRKSYCFSTDAEGNDNACPETDIDLDYLLGPLQQWIDSQYDQSIAEKNPARRNVRARAANIAFHCAMVLHMLYDQPITEDEQREVIDATIYLANYIIERFLFKFQDAQNEAFRMREEAEKVKRATTASTASTRAYTTSSISSSQVSATPSSQQFSPPPSTGRVKLTKDDAARLYREHEEQGMSWKQMMKKYHHDNDTIIRRLVRAYKTEHHLP